MMEICGCDGKVTGVRINPIKDVVKCELVVINVGVSPNLELVKNSDIKTSRGILVDKKMATSNHSIYAAGDVAEFFDPKTGRSQLNAVWLSAVLQGRVAGANIAGKPASYEPMPNMNVLTVFGTTVLGLGAPSHELKGEKIKERVVRHGHNLKKFLVSVDDGEVRGLQTVGTLTHRGLVTLLRDSVNAGTVASGLLKAGFFHPLIKFLLQRNFINR
jgi:NADPH-dependent 2,4-dienoyl-CoA reductase/sulfur reductase-like enzyme